MANPVRQRVQKIVDTNYELINDAAAQSAQLKSDIAAIIATLQAGGVEVPDDAKLARIRQYLEAILAGYMFGGVVRPDSVLPSSCTSLNRIAFLAAEPGTYTNFNGYVCDDKSYSIFFWSAGDWSRQTISLLGYSKSEIDAILASLQTFGGIATTATEPDITKVYAIQVAGVYENFDITIADNDRALVFYDKANEEWQQISIATDLTDVNARIDLIISKVATAPTYTAPTFVLDCNDMAVEQGARVSKDVTATFTQNDAGAMQSGTLGNEDFTAEEIAAGRKTITMFYDSVTSTTTFYASATYAEGPTKKNNFDIDDTRGKILAGTIGASIVIRPSLHYFYGPVDDAWTLTSENVRQLTNAAQGNKTLNTGTTCKRFVLAIPSSRTLTLVKDTATNADITSQYVLQGGIQRIADAGGALHDYKVYIMTVAVPFTASHPHAMTIN